MVGVGGRSRGCRTCRRRRVKCDETRPVCERCSKLELECEGYDRDVVFVDERVRAARPTKPRKSPLSALSGRTTAGERTEHDVSRNAFVRSELEVAATPQISLEGFSDTIQQAFIMAHLFNGYDELFPALAQPLRIRLSTKDPAITSIMKLCFGRVHKEPVSIREGFKSYQRALVSLRSDLQMEARARAPDVLMTAILLSWFENIASTSLEGWMHHTAGLSRMVEIARPEHFTTDVGGAVFDMCRFSICLYYSIIRRHCFLEQTPWKTVPRVEITDPPGFLERFIDVQADLPGISEDIEDLLAVTPVDEGRRLELSLKLQNCIQALFILRMEWDYTRPYATFEVPLTSVEYARNPWFGTAIHFTKLIWGNELLVYNSLLMLLFRLSVHLDGAESALQLLLSAAYAASQCYASPRLSKNYEAAWHELRLIMPSRYPKPAEIPAQTILPDRSSAPYLEAAPIIPQQLFRPPITNPLLLHPTQLQSPHDIAKELIRILPYHVLPHHSFQTSSFVQWALRMAYLFYEDNGGLGQDDKHSHNNRGNNNSDYFAQNSARNPETREWQSSDVHAWLARLSRQMSEISAFESFKTSFRGGYVRQRG